MNFQDVQDTRDFPYELFFSSTSSGEIDLRPLMPPIYDQGNRNSCGSQCIGALFAYQWRRYKGEILDFSRAFNYFLYRYDAHEQYSDCGGHARGFMKAAKKYGLPVSTLYSEETGISQEPYFEAMYNAMQHRLTAYYRAETMQGIIDSLNRKLPVMILSQAPAVGTDGIARDILNWNTPIYPDHFMLVVGYKNFAINGQTMPCFIVRNSYGPDWGDGGYFYAPADNFYKYGILDAWVGIYDYTELDEPVQGTGYFAYTHAYDTEDRAGVHVKELQVKGMRAFIVKTKNQFCDVYAVAVGRLFSLIEEAQKMQAYLQDVGVKSLIARV